jgi:chaperonin cofactor prefoldin
MCVKQIERMKHNFKVKNTRYTIGKWGEITNPWRLSVSCYEAWDGRQQSYEFATLEEAEQKAKELEAKLDPKDQIWRTVCEQLFRDAELANFLAEGAQEKVKRLQTRVKILERKIKRLESKTKGRAALELVNNINGEASR